MSHEQSRNNHSSIFSNGSHDGSVVRSPERSRALREMLAEDEDAADMEPTVPIRQPLSARDIAKAIIAKTTYIATSTPLAFETCHEAAQPDVAVDVDHQG